MINTGIRSLVATVTLCLTSNLTAGVVGSIDFSCSINGETTEADASLLEPNVTIFDCVSVGIPFTRGLASVQLQTAGTACEDLTGQLSLVATTTPEEIAEWGITQAGGLSAPFPVAPCPPSVVIDYGKLSGDHNTFSISIGSLFQNGPVVTKLLTAEVMWNETLTIMSTEAQTIALPLHISGSVFAAESFGTATTSATARLAMLGSVGGTSIDESVEVESVSVIPSKGSINVSDLVEVQLQPGTNFIPVAVTGSAEISSTAQGAGLVTGSATAGVSFSDSISIGRFVNVDGGPLPPGIRITDDAGEILYEDTMCLMDLSGDGSVGFADLGALLTVWGPCLGCPEDLSGDDSVGFADLAILLNAWGACPEG